MDKPSAAKVLDHAPEWVAYDGEAWKIICACSWECWGVEDEEEAWEAFNDHVFDDVNTTLKRQRDKVEVFRYA